MRVAHEVLAALPLTALMSATALGASITGTVQGPDGKPFMGAFVVAENPQNENDGQRALGPAGPLSHRQSAGGDLHGARSRRSAIRAMPHGNVAAGRRPEGVVRLRAAKGAGAWSDLTTYQGRQLLPKTADHDLTLPGHVLHHLLPVLPFVPEPDGAQDLDQDGWRSASNTCAT